MPVDVPRDRHGTFEPQLIEKYARRLPSFDDKVIHLFAHGMSLRHMQTLLHDLYGIAVSPELIATITDEVYEECEAWRLRPLDPCYAIVYLDAIHVKIRTSGTVDTHAVYLAIGIDQLGHKTILGLWLGEKEGAKFWLSVLNDLKARGVQDILIAVVDGLKGFPEALATAFPATTVQTCIGNEVSACLCFGIRCRAHRIRSAKSSPRNSRKSIERRMRTRLKQRSTHSRRASSASAIQTWCEVGGRNGIWSSPS